MTEWVSGEMVQNMD